MSKLSKRHFWEWFKRHNKEYLALNNKNKKEANYWLNELNAHLRAYYKFFGFTLVLQDKRPAILTITVNGKAMHFKKVDTFVATAPEIPGWRINALEEPMPIGFSLDKEIEDVGVHPDELYFSSHTNSQGDTSIIVYHPLCTNENEHLFLKLADKAIYNLLGERCYGMEVGWLEVENLSCADGEEGHKLEELPDYMGLSRSVMFVNDAGRLVGMS